MPDVSSWAILEAIGAASAAVFAGGQIYLSRRDSNVRAVFEHLREIDKRVQDAWAFRSEDAQRDILAYYRGEEEELTQAGRTYFALLNSLDLMAFALERKLIDAKVASEYVKTLLGPSVVSLSFIREFQDCCGENGVYEHLASYFATQRQLKKPSLPSLPER